MLAGSSAPAQPEAPPEAALLRESTPQDGASLGLHKEISDPGRCERWPRHLALRDVATGEQLTGRCQSPNECDYCATLAAVENAEVLQLDAMTNEPPSIVAILGTRSTSLKPAEFWRSREQLVKAFKRRWSRCEYCALVEYTTGYGPRAGGLRRPHWNLLLKGVPVEDVDLVRDVVGNVWCPRADAELHAQYVAAIAEFGGLSRYVAMHFQKSSQRPPAGWKGHRFLHSRGYFAAPMPEVREAARESLNWKRQRFKLKRELERQAPGVPFTPDEIHEWTERSVELNRGRRFKLVELHDELRPVLSRPTGRAVRRGLGTST